MKIFFNRKIVFAAILFGAIFAFGCKNSLDSEVQGNLEYGSISVNPSITENESRAVYIDEIKSAVVTVQGFDSSGNKFERSSGLVNVSGGKGSNIEVNTIPVTKNAVITVQAYGDANANNKISGIRLCAVKDIVSGGNSINVTWGTTKEGNIYSELLNSGVNTNILSDEQVSSINMLLSALSDYNVSLIDYRKIAENFGSFSSAENYVLQCATVSVSTKDISGYKLQIGDPCSKTQTVSSASGTITFSDVAPGTWTLYAFDKSGEVKASKSVTVESGKSYSGSVTKSSSSNVKGKIIVHVPTSTKYDHVHYWDGDAGSTEWPGNSTSDSDGDGFYDVTLSGTKTKIIFNNGTGGSAGNGQTSDLYITEGEWNYIGGNSGTKDADGTKISSNFEKVESSGNETVTIKFDSEEDQGNSSCTIHVYNSKWAGTHYLYAFTGASSITNKWPGNAMIAESTSGSYKISVDFDLSTASLIFNNSSSQYPLKDSNTIVKFPSGVKEAWFNLSDYSWTTENPYAPTKPKVILPNGTLYLGGKFTITVSSDTDLESATMVVSGTSTTGITKTLTTGANTFNVSDFASAAETSLTISVNATNSVGTTTAQTKLSVKEKLSNTIVSDPNELRIYQVMVASFQDGDSSIGYTQMWGPDGHTKGGDLQGIINAIPYIKELGCNALWMTPIFPSNTSDVKLNATGYFACDYFSIDPNFGTMSKFDELVELCHANGISVILDGVFGHNAASKGGSIGSVPNVKGVKNSGAKPSGSNPVDYANNSNSFKYYSDVARYWITEHNIDGWRFDQCYQVGLGDNGENCNTGGHNYWYDIRKVVEEAAASNGTKGVDWGTLGYMVGEHWNGDASVIQNGTVKAGNSKGYGLNSCFDFPAYYEVVRGFAQEWNGKTSGNITIGLSYLYKTYSEKGYSCLEDDGTYETYYPNFMLANHDLFRIGDLINKKHNDGFESDNYAKRNMVLLAAQAAYSGPITIYYGDEIADHNATTSSGWGEDNVARSSGKISGFSAREQKVHDWTQKCLTARAEHKALWNGTNEQIVGESDFYVAKKTSDEETIYIAFNYNASSSKSFSASGTDLLSGIKYSGTVTVPALSAVYVLAD